MVDSPDDAGTIQALLQRLNKQRLPRLLEIQKRVTGGEPIGDTDVDFLDTVQRDAGDVMRLAEKHPEIQSVVAKVIHLYDDITRKAIENEQKTPKK